MNPKLKELYNKIKKNGLTPEQEQKILLELYDDATHDFPDESSGAPQTGDEAFRTTSQNIYTYNDLFNLQAITALQSTHNVSIRSIDELLERDKQREKDGFPRKINVGRLIKPGRGGRDKVVVVPSTVEEKFIHDTSLQTEEEQPYGGSGDGEEGEVIGEQPIRAPDVQGGTGPGQGEGGQHEIESNAYDLGKILTEKFELPNLKDKGKKRSLTRYTYDLTDKHRGFGQLLDKKATLRKIVETNMHLGNLTDISDLDLTRFLVSPKDLVYRILSREKDYESQAMVFFVRDYSGSMAGKSTVLIVAQHVLIYSWLLYQYAMQVETRFILHDTEATEVPDFYSYYNSKVAGGTQVSSAYRLVNEIVEKENLVRDYNIYIFHGTDGDDWDTDGKESLPQLKQMLTYTNRVGITIAEHAHGKTNNSEVEKYLKKSGLLEEKKDLLRMDVMQEDADEPRLIEGIKHLISE
ncbi:MAG: DUF444 family protein [Desulfobacterales bacterium]|nr:MAG: DUF444 family protein [Desulfobacterales bacterium]